MWSDTPDETIAPPRPLVQRPWTDLSGTWEFRYDDAEIGRDQEWGRWWPESELSIEVPYPPESPLSGIHDTRFHPVVWYRRLFRCSPDRDRRVLLHFGAVDYLATVWVNGQMVAEHEGGHTPFCADITEVLRDGDQEVVVRAEDQPHDLGQPRGKQDWMLEPHAIWYHRTTGIWQPVWLEETAATRIDSLRWTPDLEAGSVALAIRVNRVTPGLRLRVRLSRAGELLVDDSYTVTAADSRREIGLNKGLITLRRREWVWSPEHPNLIDAELELTDDRGAVDHVKSYTALRSTTITDSRFHLNNRPYFLRLVLDQGYWPQSHLAAPSLEALRDEAALVKSLGFNGVRMHQKICHPQTLYWADRLGLLVWVEMPAAYEFSPRTAGRLVREWLEVLERDCSHPCVMAWVPFNESWGVPELPTSAAQRDLVRSVYYLTKAVDPTRPVIGNDGWEQVVADIITVHDYSKRGETLRERYGSREAVDDTLKHVQPSYHLVLLPDNAIGDSPVMISEFGGITLASTIRGQAWGAYGSTPDTESFLERYRGLVDALLDSPSISGFCYTQLTDTVQEQNGLVTEDREPKVPIEAIRTINCRTSAAVPADEIGAFQHGEYNPLAERIDQVEPVVERRQPAPVSGQ